MSQSSLSRNVIPAQPRALSAVWFPCHKQSVSTFCLCAMWPCASWVCPPIPFSWRDFKTWTHTLTCSPLACGQCCWFLTHCSLYAHTTGRYSHGVPRSQSQSSITNVISLLFASPCLNTCVQNWTAGLQVHFLQRVLFNSPAPGWICCMLRLFWHKTNKTVIMVEASIYVLFSSTEWRNHFYLSLPTLFILYSW